MSFTNTERWKRPLTLDEVATATKTNFSNKNNIVELIKGFDLGPLLKATDTTSGNKYYCGGHLGNERWAWKREPAFFEAYPEMAPSRPTMVDPMFDLEDMELAEIIMDELK